MPGLLVLLPLTGCGSKQAAGDDPGATTSPRVGTGQDTVAPKAETRLQISVKASAQAPAKNFTLTCDPVGGTLPDADKACAALAKAKADWYAPVPQDKACTMIYGGPEQASIKGVWQGKRIGAAFKRTNGCELARWNAVGTVFGKVPPVR